MTKMKIKKEITPDQCQELILNPNLEEVGYYPGCLLDNYLLYNWDNKKYIIIREKYVNCWTSTLIATETDDEKLVDNFLKEQDKVLDEIDAE